MKKVLFIIGLLITCFINAQEICNNGIDDDGDGLIDLNDNVDCVCNGFSTGQTIPSLIPNPSFEQRTCCPFGLSALNCATGWIQATNATSDYLNTCGYIVGAATGNGLVPPPDGTGFVGIIVTNGYKEYVGSCLMSPLTAGTSYNLSMQIASNYAGSGSSGPVLGYIGSSSPPPINMVIYGSTGCLSTPLNTFDCPGSGWDVIAIQSYTPANSWGVINFVFTPTVNINSIIIGPPCVVPSIGYSGNYYPYFYLDNLILNTSASFGTTHITEVGSFCGNNLALNASADSSGGSWQWYKNGIALVGQTTATLNVSTNSLGSGKYTILYTRGSMCEAIDKTLTSPSLPIANFNLTNGCLNTASNFISTSTPTANIVSQIWNYGDNSSVVTGSVVSHSYLSAGTYTVKLVVSDAAQCKDSVIKPIIVYPKPVITISSGTVCSGFAISFTNSSSVPLPDYISNWYWDFDNNGTTDNITQTPSYTYSGSGTYAAELKTKTGFGCLDSSVVAVKIQPLPSITFTANNACINSNVQLSNSSTVSSGTISSWSWNFGANSTPLSSTNATPSLSYSTSGVKTITLSAMSTHSCIASMTNTVLIYPDPIPSFTFTNTCFNSQPLNFDASGSTIPVGTNTLYSWAYGDGNSSSGAMVSTSHSYLTAGLYNATLTVTSDQGCTHTLSKQVEIYPKPVITISSGTVCSGFATAFTSTSSVPLPDYISNWYWDFDNNGTTDNITQTPSYTYSASGTYTAELKTKTGFGCLDSSVVAVKIQPLPSMTFTATNACINSNVQLSNSSTVSSGSISSWSWNFGANSTPLSSTNATPSLSYSTSGIKTITLSATSTHSCSASMTNTVLIYPDPIPAFTFTNACVNSQPFNFDASGSTIPVGTNTLYSWAYGDGNSSSGAMVSSSHSYLTAGLYNATLTITSDQGCTRTLSKQVEIYLKPLATVSVGQACLGSTTQFTANTLPGSGNINQWLWDLNNTKSSIEGTGKQNGYIFGIAGTQTVTLITVTDHNCMDTVSRTTYINYNPQPQFVVDKSAGCSPHCVTFTDNTPAIPSPAKIVSWNWIFGNGTSINSTTNGSQSRCYTNSSSSQPALFNVTLVTVTDSACSNMITKSNYITVYPKPIAAYFPNPNPGNIVTPLVYFTNLSQDYNKFYWYFGDSPLIDSVNINPTHLYSDASTATYNSTLIVSNQYNCIDTAYVQIEIGPEFTFYIPDAFTPEDPNGVNDVFTGKGIGIIKYEMWIYDRWGVNLFYTDDINKGWDGRIQGQDEGAKQDVYTWQVKLTDVLRKPHEYVGRVTLIR